MDKTNFAKRMKAQEQVETKVKFDKTKHLVVRLDGRSFSKFTKRFKRPFDDNFRSVMEATTEYLIQQTNALVGYTQSDEITLIIEPCTGASELLFNAKKFKILSNLASMATSKFVVEAMQYWPEHVTKALPSFDCRAFNVDSETEAMNHLLWRYKDCVRNSISMVAHHYFSHNELKKKSTVEKLNMLRLRKGVEWSEYPERCKYGTIIYRRAQEYVLSREELQKIPPVHRPDDGKVIRKVLIRDNMSDMFVAHLKHVLYDASSCESTTHECM